MPSISAQTKTADGGRTKRKRAQARHDDGGDDSDESKKRGRPRVEKQDESAADRRRTQIRLAQRAYRQRKESTLDDLRRRLAEVAGAVEAAGTAFQECRARMTASGLNKSQLNDLHTISCHLEQLANMVQNGDSIEPVAVALPTPPSSSKSHDGADDVQSIEMDVPRWAHQADSQLTSPKPEWSTSDGAYSTFPSNTAYDAIEMNDVQHNFGSDQNMAQNTGTLSLGGSRSITPDSITLPISLTPPRSYSFLETSFARRLHRMSLEAAYDLLVNRSRRPKSYERIFQLSLLGRSREKLIASMRSVLDRGPQASLDFWEAPLIHVGGAGTHYARRNQFGELQPKKTPDYIGIFGPQALSTLENAARDSVSTDMTVEIAGFEGEWLDSYDVDGYLESKGIHIEPWASVIMVEATEWPAHSELSPPAGPPPKFSTLDRSSAFDSVQLRMLANMEADVSRWNDLVPSTFSGVRDPHAVSQSWLHFPDMDFSASTARLAMDSHVEMGYNAGIFDVMRDVPITTDLGDSSSMLHLSTGHARQLPMYSPQRRIVYVDVMRFMKALIVSAVCLGRTAGYRRRDVDRALAMASFDIEP